jgi:hypothetical protein
VNRLQLISSPNLILCEGIDAKLFLIYYLDFSYGKNQQVFKVADFGGINELDKKSLKVLPLLPGYEKLKSITIIRDAEKDALSASRSVQSSLRTNGYAVPTKPCEVMKPTKEQHHVTVAYSLFPTFDSLTGNGSLEDLCKKVISDENRDIVFGISSDAVSSVEKRLNPFKRRHKNDLHTYLSLTDNYVGLKIGESARAGAFDFSKNSFEPLKNLLENIRD